MNRASPRISLILPCYNEMEHIEDSLAKISSYMSYVFPSQSYEIILIDDGSVDGTREWLKQIKTPNILTHLNPKNLGRGGTVKEGLRLSRGEVIGFMDIDCEVSESYLPKFIQTIDSGVDLANANRIYKVGLNPYMVLRHLLSLGYRWILKSFAHIKVVDSEAGYKFFSRRFADYLSVESRFDDWFWDTECVLLAQKFNFKIEEIPVAFCRNPSKTSTVRIFRDSYRYLKALLRFKRLESAKAYTLPTQSICPMILKKRAS